jgi:site-specific recombinase XerD
LRGTTWWIQYSLDGRKIRESAETTQRTEAARLLADRVGRLARGEPVLPRAGRVTVDEALGDLETHYRTTGERDLEEAGYRLARLREFFSGYRLTAITPDRITSYAASRQAAGASNATINRETAVLGRALRLAAENGKLVRVPSLRKLKEAAPRQGFLERPQYASVRRRLEPDLQLALTIAYSYGWRMQSEVLALERRQLNLEAGTLRLDAGGTKNDDGRVVYLTPELRRLFAAQVERIRTVEKKTGRIVPYLFPHLTGRARLGQRRRDFRRAWTTATRAAGLPGVLRHDCRRSAVRNMVNDGVHERVAMEITGHKTRSVFDRYHIVSPEDLRAAAAVIGAAADTAQA